MIKEFLAHTIASLFVLWLATNIVPGVSFNGPFQIMLLCAGFLGFLDAFVKPLAKLVTFPLRILTLGLLNIILNLLMLKFVDMAFPELVIEGIVPFLLTTLMLGVTTSILQTKI